MALGCSAPNAIRLVDLAIAGDDLDWPAVTCRPWLSRQAKGSTFGQLKYLPSCRTRGFPTSANFESKPLGQGSDVVGKQRNANHQGPCFKNWGQPPAEVGDQPAA